MPPPLALLAVAFALGIALAEQIGAAALPRWQLAVCLGALAGVATWLRLRLRLVGGPALLVALGAGALLDARSHPRAPPGLLDGKPAVVTARVVSPPERSPLPPPPGSALPPSVRTRLLVELVEERRDDRVRRIAGRAQLSVPGPLVEALVPGDRLLGEVRLLAPHGFHEPDSPDPDVRTAERGVIAVGGVGNPLQVARLAVGDAPRAGPVERLLGAAEAERLRLLALVDRHLDDPRRPEAWRDGRALVESLVLGERGGISRALDEDFRRAGVSHVLSVSGLHLAIAGFLAFVGLRRLLLFVTPLSRRYAVQRIAAMAAIPATGLYTLMTGAAVATVRSCATSWLVLLGIALGRPATAPGALAASALVLLAHSPLSLFDPSFQLSFAAALGTVALGTPAARLLLGGMAQRPGRLVAVLRGALRLVVASAAALLSTAPVTAWHFGQVAPAGLLANLVVVPLAEGWVLPVGFAGCLLGGWDRLAGLFLVGAGWGARAMAAVAHAFAEHAPEGRMAAPSLLAIALFAGALVALAVALHRFVDEERAGGRAALRVALALAVGALLPGAAGAVYRRLDPAVTVTFLDVGQGDAALVELPDGRTLLVDGGGSFDPRFDPGAQVLTPWLRRRGVTRLDVVVLTHPHPDHAGGLASVVAAFAVGEIWELGQPTEAPSVRALREVARARGVPVRPPHPLPAPGPGGAAVDVLAPLVGGVVRAPPGTSENDQSIVLRVRYGGRAVLLGGDIERRAEARLLAGEPALALQADVLKVPHHCSRTSSTEALLASVRPRLAVCSVGAANRWGFPQPDVLARYARAGTRVLRTDEDGGITVRLSGRGRIDAAAARRGDRFHRLE